MRTERAGRGFDPFRILSRRERELHLDGYLRFLEQLDGPLERGDMTLARREHYFDELQRKPVEWAGPIDYEALHDHLGRYFDSSGGAEIDRKTAWLVLVAKANSGEAYGVGRELQKLSAAGTRAPTDELYLRMLAQESYHSRILIEACKTCGVEVELPVPHWNQRILIDIVMRLPESMRWVLVFCGEIAGCAVFEALHDNCSAFSAEPEVEQRLRSLLADIWRDEVLHVAYLRARLGRVAMTVARLLSPMVTRNAWLYLPQLRWLGVRASDLVDRLELGLQIPDGIDWMAPDPAADR